MLSGTHRNSLQEQVIYGRPALEALTDLAKSFGAHRLMITSTASLAGPGGLAQRLAKDSGAACVGIFAGVSAHSPREGVIAGAAEARRLGADLLVAVGGGSVIDATKVMQLALWAGVESAEGLGALPRRPGTGSCGCLEANPRRSLDPAMTLSTPSQLWFSTGMKAVDHAVEQLCNPVRSPYADALAEAGLKGLVQGLLATKERPSDLDARLECQIGMWLAMAGASAGRGLGASHAIGHTLGGSFGVPHGLTSCVALPAVLRWNERVASDRQKLVAALLRNPEFSASDAVRTLAHALDLPTDLAAIGIRPGQFRAIAEHTLHDRGIRSNPRPIKGADDIMEILELARGTRGGRS